VAQAHRGKKGRLTISLTPETIKFLQRRRVEAQAPSMSAYLEGVFRELQARAELASYQAAATEYYDKLGAAQAEEESNWGRFGTASLSRLDD